MAGTNNSKNGARRLDRALVGWRWASLLVVTAAVFIAQQRPIQPFDWVNDIGIAFGAGALVNLVLWAAVEVNGLYPVKRYVLLAGDALVALLFVRVGGGDPLLTTVILAALLPGGVFGLGDALGIVHGVVILVMAGVGLVMSQGVDSLLDSFTIYLPSLLALAVIEAALVFWSRSLEDAVRHRARQLKEINASRAQQVAEMRDQLQVFSRIANTLNSTLKFQKILDTALDIGAIGLRRREGQRFISIVMLFRPDNSLYIASARGLSHLQEQRVLEGKEGILAEALEEAMPVIGKNAWEDPELKSFVAFQDIASTLVIPLRAGYDNFGLLIFGTDDANAFNADHIEILGAIGTQATIALQNAILYGNLTAEKDRIIELEEDARKALVRDLHDVPTQTVSSIVMRLRIIQRLMEKNPEEVMGELKQVEAMAVRATEEIRHVLFKLRPLALESQGLGAALDQLADKMQTTYHQAVAVRVGRDLEKYLDTHQQGVLFYLIEEAVNNSRKYAQAELISVEVGHQNKVIVARIADNGVGFDTESVDKGYDKRGSFGMVNMRERAELLDGQLELRSAPGRGTSITVVIPAESPINGADGERMPPTITKLERAALKSLKRT